MNYSYWEKEYLLADIDYLVVGMGLVGLQTAIHLKEKETSAKVVVIDRHAWGLGASTRNAGFACFANISEILDDLQKDTSENVYKTIKKRYQGLQKLRAKFGDEDLGYLEKGSCEIFTSENKTSLHNGIDSLQGINSILYDELGLDRIFTYKSNHTLPETIGAIHNNFEGQINTGKMYASIYDFAQQLGIKLYGGIHVKSWTNSGQIEVETDQDLTLKTSHLILCTNAFTNKLIDEDVSPCRGQVIVSEQVKNLPCKGLHHYDGGYYYWRDIDNRILLGGARNKDFEGENTMEISQNKPIVVELKRFMNDQIFGKPVRIDYEWSGIMGMGNGNKKTPIVKQLEPQVHIAARLGGMGVALSANVSEDLTELIFNP